MTSRMVTQGSLLSTLYSEVVVPPNVLVETIDTRNSFSTIGPTLPVLPFGVSSTPGS